MFFLDSVITWILFIWLWFICVCKLLETFVILRHQNKTTGETEWQGGALKYRSVIQLHFFFFRLYSFIINCFSAFKSGFLFWHINHPLGVILTRAPFKRLEMHISLARVTYLDLRRLSKTSRFLLMSMVPFLNWDGILGFFHAKVSYRREGFITYTFYYMLYITCISDALACCSVSTCFISYTCFYTLFGFHGNILSIYFLESVKLTYIILDLLS